MIGAYLGARIPAIENCIELDDNVPDILIVLLDVDIILHAPDIILLYEHVNVYIINDAYNDTTK
jgi:hypothetical protein